ncbi:MAG: hypothetical protein ACI8X5_003104 [Planctomycetota bacterium]
MFGQGEDGHLVERALKPGPAFSSILERCQELQEEAGSRQVEVVLARYEAAFGLLEAELG